MDIDELSEMISNPKDLIGLTIKKAMKEYNIKDKDLFLEYMERNELNICDICNEIELTNYLYWLDWLCDAEIRELGLDKNKISKELQKGNVSVCKYCLKYLK